MTDFGVTQAGFVLKTFDAILADALNRAVSMFGANIDLTSTSPLRKLIEAGALEDAEVWKQLEDFYYGAFVSTATGDSLDLLADDVGLARREEFATGEVTLTLGGAVQGRTYVIPQGTVLLAPRPGQAFATASTVQLSGTATTANVAVTAFTRGPGGDVGAGTITTIDPAYAAVYLADFGAATVSVTNGARRPEAWPRRTTTPCAAACSASPAPCGRRRPRSSRSSTSTASWMCCSPTRSAGSTSRRATSASSTSANGCSAPNAGSASRTSSTSWWRTTSPGPGRPLGRCPGC